MHIISTTAIVMILTWIMVGAGGWLRGHFRLDEQEYRPCFWLAIDFFIGFAVLFSLGRACSLVLDSVSASYALAAVLLGVLSIVRAKVGLRSGSLTWSMLVKWVAAFAVMTVFVLLVWVQNDASSGPYAILGSLHSPRYANIALFIVHNDRIPVLGQNYAQSVLAALPGFWVVPLPLWALCLWLSVTLTFLWALVLGLISRFSTNAGFRCLATILVMCGGTALSLDWILVIDSGSPWYVTGYSDAIASIGTLMVALLILENNKNALMWHQRACIAGIAFCLALLWAASAPQNFPAFMAIAGISAVARTRTKSSASWGRMIGFLVPFLVGVLPGVLGGGMLTPGFLRDSSDIPGLMVVSRLGEKTIKLNPAVPYQVARDTKWVWRGEVRPNEGHSVRDVFEKRSELPRRTVLKVLAGWLLSEGLKTLKVLFFPMLGLALFARCKPEDTVNLADKVGVIAGVLLLEGLVIVFPISLHGYKWELSRFLIPGYFFCGVCLSLGVWRRMRAHGDRLALLVLGMVTVMACVGPALGASRLVKKNVESPKKFYERIDMVMRSYEHYVE